MEFGPQKQGDTDLYNPATMVTSALCAPLEGLLRGFYNERAEYYDKAPHEALQTPQNVLKSWAASYRDIFEMANISGRTYDYDEFYQDKQNETGRLYPRITMHGPINAQRGVTLFINKEGIATGGSILTLDRNGNAASGKTSNLKGVFNSYGDENLAQRVDCFVAEWNKATGENIQLNGVNVNANPHGDAIVYPLSPDRTTPSAQSCAALKQ